MYFEVLAEQGLTTSTEEACITLLIGNLDQCGDLQMTHRDPHVRNTTVTNFESLDIFSHFHNDTYSFMSWNKLT